MAVTKPIIEKLAAGKGESDSQKKDNQESPLNTFDQVIQGWAHPIPQGGEEYRPDQATDKLKSKELGNLHIQNAKTEGAGQADTEHVLGDKQAQGFIAPDDILGLVNLDF